MSLGEQPGRVAHRGRERVRRTVGTGRLYEHARGNEWSETLGAVESSDRWLEGLDGLRNVQVGRHPGRLNEPGRRGACVHGGQSTSMLRGGGDGALNAEVLGTTSGRLRKKAVSRTFMTSDFGIGRAAAFFATFLPTFVRVLSGMTTRVLRGLLARERKNTRLVLENSGNSSVGRGSNVHHGSSSRPCRHPEPSGEGSRCVLIEGPLPGESRSFG